MIIVAVVVNPGNFSFISALEEFRIFSRVLNSNHPLLSVTWSIMDNFFSCIANYHTVGVGGWGGETLCNWIF